MAEKKEVKIPEMLFFQEGPGVRNTQYTTSGVKLLNVANLVEGKVDLSTSDRYISEDVAYGKYNHFLCDEDDFIVASSGIKVDYIDKKMGFITKEMLPLCMNTSTIRFKVLDDSKLNIRYFMYFLKSNAFKKQLAKQVTGSAQLNYGPSHLKQMTFPLIDIKSQNDLVKKLDYLIQIIDKKNESIRKYDDLIKARFVEMFKDCIESVKLEQVVTSIKTGKLDANVEKKDGKYPFFTCDAIPKRIDDYAFDAEAILISGNGSRVGHVHYYKGKFNAYQRTYVLSDFRHDIDLSYLKTYLENELRPYIARNKKGSAVPYITLPMLQNFKLPFPPLEKQKEFATFVAQIDKSKFALSNELAMGNFYIRLIHDCIMHGCIDL